MRLKLNLDFGVGFYKAETYHTKPSGIFVSLNNNRLELRRKRKYEKDGADSQGNVYSEGVKNHGWKDSERGPFYATAFYSITENFCISLFKNKKSYSEVTGVSDLSIDGLLDEFDSNFDALAAASLEYHMKYSVASCSEEMTKKYKDIQDRLFPNDSFTEEELSHLEECSKKHEGFTSLSKRGCSDCEAIYSNFGERQDNTQKIRMQARHDFIDITPSLWS